MERADAVVSGCVAKVTLNRDESVVVEMDVSKSIKGNLSGRITIETSLNGASCGVSGAFTTAIQSFSLITVGLSVDKQHPGVFYAHMCNQIDGVSGVTPNNFDGDKEQCAQ